jgi:GNAT superfamily N-acetyltransferase
MASSDAMTSNGLDSLTVARFEEGVQAADAQELAEDWIGVGAGVATFFEPGSSLNQAWNQGLHGPVDDDDVESIVDFFTERGIEARLPVCALADASLVTALASRGFVTDAFINVFAVDLTIEAPGLEGDVRAAPPAEIEVVDATDDDRVAEWAWTTSAGFQDGGDPPGAMLRASAAFARRASNTALLARVGGVAAGGAVVSVTSSDDGTVGAGLFGTSVMPGFRRRGIQQQLMAERLQLARERGAVLATIGSNPGVATERNAAQFGFFLSYVKAVQSRPIHPH